MGTVLFFGAALISNLFIPFFSEKWGRKQVMIITAGSIAYFLCRPAFYAVFFNSTHFHLAFRFGIFHNAFKYACLGNGCGLCRLCGMENRNSRGWCGDFEHEALSISWVWRWPGHFRPSI